ncbi:MAG: ECF transporter S component [Candidatus Limivicinus sp.]|nr:ECF transporter S component [Clostridiales bacterium]MDY3859049.1 ECF transporter S component [Candidatus Limivicinus sp.]
MSNATPRKGLRRKTGLALFSAIIVVLQVLSNFVRFGPFPITLALAPIIIGAAVYGSSAGALLGGVFGLVVLLTGIIGWDGGTVMLLMGINAFGCILICIGKGVLAGWLAGLVYRLLAKKKELIGVVVAGIVCPVVNTGLFILGMLTFFTSTLESWASGQGMIYFVLFGLAGVNFLVELAVNLVLSSGITSIIKYAKKG